MQNNKEAYAELLNKLSEFLGFELSYEDDSCSLYLDNMDISFTIRKYEDEGRIVLMGVIAEELPDEISFSLIEEFLDSALNPLYKAGPTIARDFQSEMIVAYVSVDIKDIEPDDFPKIVEQFIDFQVYYTERLRGDVSDAQPDVQKDSEILDAIMNKA